MSRSSTQPHYVGVDLGGTKILAAVFDHRHKLLAREKKSTKPLLGPAAVVERVAECVNDALAAAAVPHGAVAGLGVGVPGMVNSKTGLVKVAPNLHWKELPFGRMLQRRLRIPVIVVNDVEAGTLAVQEFGAGRGLQHFVCMFIGTGIGGGLVLHGQQYRGAGGLGGEIGHMAVIAHDGPRCGCGNRGCLESVASRSAIVRRITQQIDGGAKSIVKELCDGNLRRIRSRILAKAYRDGDKVVRDVIHDACEYIGIGAANLINTLNPQSVILGGGVIEAMGPVMLPRIRRAAWRHVIGPTDQRVHIVDSGLGDDAGILGSELAAHRLAVQTPKPKA